MSFWHLLVSCHGLIFALCLGNKVVQNILQSFPVFLGATGQIGDIQTGIVNAAGHAVDVGQQGVRILPDKRPCLSKALLVNAGQGIVPLVISILDGSGSLQGEFGVLRPLEQRRRRDDRF